LGNREDKEEEETKVELLFENEKLMEWRYQLKNNKRPLQYEDID